MRVGLVQLDSGADRAANLAQITGYVRAAAQQGAELVLLPEACTYRGPLHPAAVEDPAGPSELKELAAANGVALLAGGIWLASHDPKKPYNASLLLDEDGQLIARYDKVHLFRVNDPQVTEDETSVTTPGGQLVVASWHGWQLGLSVCYDLRFPELYRALAQAGADVLCVPANFSACTGPPHWRPLLQARAIENLCHVLAPAQCGVAPDGFASHGHTLAISPWGTVSTEAGQQPGLHLTDITRDELDARRTTLNSPGETRPDVYRRPVHRSVAGVR